MTGHNEYSFHRSAAFAYAGCRSSAGAPLGRSGARRVHLDILPESVRRAVMSAQRRPAHVGWQRHGNPVAAAFRDDDSRQELVT
ncbi:hypothetical protein DF143_03290 [Burkholderia cenocepacia]|nr:hypothetical protein DF143_03290 [Burkholderia cenocepacia]RQV50559.1 hypothetical protein DF033_03295 [Burkholderia cenocepacia]